MSAKRRRGAPAAAVRSLEQADERIGFLQDKVLPPVPHLLSIPTKHMVRTEYPNDYRELFGFSSQREFEAMQYMTLITPTDGERGPFLETRGNWEDEMAALEAHSRSNSGTPVPQKTFANKVSFSAYRKNGFKAPSQATTPNVTAGLGHSRNVSTGSASISMARGLSFEGREDARTNGSASIERSGFGQDSASRTQTSRSHDAQERSTGSVNNGRLSNSASRGESSARTGTNGTTRDQDSSTRTDTRQSKALSGTERKSAIGATNGSLPPKPSANASDAYRSQKPSQESRRDNESGKNVSESSTRSALQNKQSNKEIDRKQADRPRPQHALPRKPSPPPLKASTPTQRSDQLKRYSDNSVDRPDKRLKTEASRTPSGHTRTPSNSSTSFPRKPDPSGLPAKPPTSAVSANRPGIQSRPLDNASKRKQNSSQRASPRPETPKDLPPLLSPLPANLESSPPAEAPPRSSLPSTSLNNSRKQDDHDRRGNASKRKTEDDEASAGAKRVKRSESPVAPVKRERSGALPRLLSPDLPPVIEKALDEVQEEKKKHQTVEERHELARQPGAKGVARKTVKPKSGKRRGPQTSASPDPIVESEFSEQEDAQKDPLIVKLKYKRKNVKHIERILRLAPRAGAPAKGKARSETPALKASALPKDDESSEEEIPLAKASATKKRPVTSAPAESASKGSKKSVPDSSSSVPSQSSAPAKKSTPVPSARHDSPVQSSTSNKNLLSTPKKSEAMKSVAMRRVDSSEALSRTPQPAPTSTPSSVARSIMSDSRLSTAEIEKMRVEQAKAGSLALKIKRKMDEILKIKVKPRPEISAKEKKLGIATGLEAMILYMNNHVLIEKLSHTRSSEGWNQVLGLMKWLETESRDIDVLHALLLQLSALSKEFLERALVDPNNKDPKDSELLAKIARNSISRTYDWIEAEKKRKCLEPLGGPSIMGPGSDIKDITAYSIGVLTAYSRKEQTGWKKDPEFANVFS